MENIRVKISADIPFELRPIYATEGAAGADLMASESGELAPGEYKTINTGVRLELPPGYEAQIRPRSGLAAKNGVTMLNSPGTVDSDFRGEIRVIMINHGKEPFIYKKGDRVAQMVIAPCAKCVFEPSESLSSTKRGEGGFGHTGK